MEWKVQSELEWFTEDPGVQQQERSFLGHTRKKNGKKTKLPCMSHSSASVLLRFVLLLGEGASRTFSTLKNQQERAALKEPFQLSFQTECYAGRLAPRH